MRSRWSLVVAAGTVLLVSLLVLGYGVTRSGGEGRAPSPTQTTQPLATPSFTTAAAEPIPTPTRAAVASAPLRVQVPAVGLDAAVVPITPSGGELDPPRLDRAYWIETYGSPGPDSNNTVYLAGHSIDRGAAVFDPLFDQAEQSALVEAGDEITITTDAGDMRYVVEETRRYPKSELADAAEVWRIVPGRLVLITCFQRDDGGRSTDNLVVYAQRA